MHRPVCIQWLAPAVGKMTSFRDAPMRTACLLLFLPFTASAVPLLVDAGASVGHDEIGDTWDLLAADPWQTPFCQPAYRRRVSGPVGMLEQLAKLVDSFLEEHAAPEQAEPGDGTAPAAAS